MNVGRTLQKDDTVYGVMPNAFWASQLALLPEGSVCLPCDGEGRNAVHAAEQGWSVYAFDASPEGVRKSARLAQDRGVSIEVEVADALQVDVTQTFDVVGLIFAHMPVELREFHQGLGLGSNQEEVDRGRVSQDALGLVREVQSVWTCSTTRARLWRTLRKGQTAPGYLWNARCEQILDEGPFHQGAAVTSQWVIQKMDDGAL